LAAKKRILFFGFSDVGYKCLKLLLEDRRVQVIGVFTHDTDPHEKQWFETPEALAKSRGIAVYKPQSLKGEEWAKLVTGLAPDIILSLFYRNFIPPQIFGSARLGAYNMHGSYLPTYRGRAPLNWAIINGENYGGVSLHVLEKSFDTGDIVGQKKVRFGKREYAGAIQPRITAAAQSVLKRALPSLLKGSPRLKKQDDSKATYFGKRTPEDGRLDFSKPAKDVFNMVRALGKPFPGAFTDAFGRRLIIWQALPVSKSAALEAARKSCGKNFKRASFDALQAGAKVAESPLIIKCANDTFLKVSDSQNA